jgi:hypothetical protein
MVGAWLLGISTVDGGRPDWSTVCSSTKLPLADDV